MDIEIGGSWLPDKKNYNRKSEFEAEKNLSSEEHYPRKNIYKFNIDKERDLK